MDSFIETQRSAGNNLSIFGHFKTKFKVPSNLATSRYVQRVAGRNLGFSYLSLSALLLCTSLEDALSIV